MLSMWKGGLSIDAFSDKVRDDGWIEADLSDIEHLILFLHKNWLTTAPQNSGWRHFVSERDRARRSVLSWLIHNYLFVRIPLVRPQAFLERTMPVADFLASRVAVWSVAVLGCVGCYLTLRQWEQFVGSVPEIFTVEGMALGALALFLIKAAHELGHGYTAVRVGCRVPTMGLAIILLAPLFYTDVTDSWRLQDRRKRFRIDSAGIKVEVAIAALALFAWAFLPDGLARGLAFSICVVSLASSLMVNLNPFMRFDGYYLLSDALGVDNLQSRSFALGVWKLRELLFALGAPCPEFMPPARVRLLIAYAWATWIYRLFLFIAIALLVYHFVFKALGIILFVIEIVVFVLRPVFGELRNWYHMRKRILATRRTRVTGGALCLLVALVAFPWSTRVVLPAVIEYEVMQPVHPIRAGLVTAVDTIHGQQISAGMTLLTLASPDLDHEIALASTELRVAEVRYARRGSDSIDREASMVLENRMRALKDKLVGLERQRAELVLRAPIDGRIVEADPQLHVGRWIGPATRVAMVGDPHSHAVRGYVREADVWRITAGTDGHFIPDDIARPPVAVTVAGIAPGATTRLQLPELSTDERGWIGVVPNREGEMVPAAAQYAVLMKVRDPIAHQDLAVRGVAVLNGTAESLLAKFWRRVLQVLIRESGA